MNEIETRTRFLELLPDLVADKLDTDERRWIEQQIQTSPRARDVAELHRALTEVMAEELADIPVEAVRKGADRLIAQAQASTAMARQEFLEQLPAYVADTLSQEQRDSMDREIARTPWAAEALHQHRALAQSLRQELTSTDVADVRAKARALIERSQETSQRPAAQPQPTPRAPNPTSARREQSLAERVTELVSQWLSMLTPQRLAPALALVVVVQSGLLAYQWKEPAELDRGSKGNTSFVSGKTLRVRFAPEATAEQIKKGLNASGATVVGGPNQFGDYWLASSVYSRQEMRDALVATGLLSEPPIDDDKGPPSQ